MLIRRARPARAEIDEAALALLARHGAQILATAERYEDLRQGAEALGQLKPQEIRALLLRAEGYSYAEICEITGWSYTKVNRCLTEGRQALSVRLAGIQGGIECAKLAPLLSALADGEASADQLARLRPHMKTCLACRATLRAFREAPEQVAAWSSPAALLASDPASPGGGPRSAPDAGAGPCGVGARYAGGARASAAASPATRPVERVRA